MLIGNRDKNRIRQSLFIKIRRTVFQCQEEHVDYSANNLMNPGVSAIYIPYDKPTKIRKCRIFLASRKVKKLNLYFTNGHEYD